MTQRTIKFRAWDKEKKTMIIESLVWRDENGWKATMPFFGIHPDDLSDLMQFTNLHDNNGKELYEGDIVKIRDTFHEYPVSIVWIDRDACYGFDVRDQSSFGNISEWIGAMELIGNKWENPELLEAKKES